MDTAVYLQACGHLNASRVIPRRHSRRLDASNNLARLVLALDAPTVSAGARCNSERVRINRCGRKMENGIDASGFSSWERAPLDLVEIIGRIPLSRLILLSLAEIYLITRERTMTMLRGWARGLRWKERTGQAELRVQSLTQFIVDFFCRLRELCRAENESRGEQLGARFEPRNGSFPAFHFLGSVTKVVSRFTFSCRLVKRLPATPASPGARGGRGRLYEPWRVPKSSRVKR